MTDSLGTVEGHDGILCIRSSGNVRQWNGNQWQPNGKGGRKLPMLPPGMPSKPAPTPS